MARSSALKNVKWAVHRSRSEATFTGRTPRCPKDNKPLKKEGKIQYCMWCGYQEKV